ncbi:MAG: DUF992 domain-containing protein [Gammaproteobacteria bacterium]
MNKKSMFISLFCVIAGMAPQTGFTEDTQGGIQVGIITCTVIPNTRVNLLIRSTADVECVYENQGQTEKYIGETGIALGLDLSIKKDEKFAFTVIAASADVQPGAHALAGKYVGGTLGAAVGVGLSASALIGGGEKNISLQPLALGTSTGIGAAGGIGFLYIEAAK